MVSLVEEEEVVRFRIDASMKIPAGLEYGEKIQEIYENLGSDLTMHISRDHIVLIEDEEE